MVCFELVRNGVPLCRAGTGDPGLLSLDVHWSPNQAWLSMTGIRGDYSVEWLSIEPLNIGDELLVRIVETEQPVDDPKITGKIFPMTPEDETMVSEAAQKARDRVESETQSSDQT